jgi:hypothetical protein
MLLERANYDLEQLAEERWDPSLSPVLIHWQEFFRRVGTTIGWWSQPVSLVSGTYARENLDWLKPVATSPLFPRWTSGSAVLTLRTRGQPTQMTLEYFDSRPGTGADSVQLYVDGTPLPAAATKLSLSDSELPDGARPWILRADLEDAIAGKDSATLEIRSKPWQPARDLPPNPDVRQLGILIWQLQVESNGVDLPVGEAPFSPMPVSDQQPWSYELQTWFYTPPHLADVWVWYLYLAGLPRALLALAALPAAGLVWSSLAIASLIRRGSDTASVVR